MPNGRRVRGVRAETAVRAFQRFGFEVDRIHGSHYILLHPDGRLVVIPRHGELKPCLLLDQLKKAGITWEDFGEPL